MVPAVPNFCNQTVSPTATKFGMDWRVSGGQPRPRPKGWGPASTNFFGPTCAHSMRTNNQILHGDQIRCEANFTQSITNADARSVCGR